MLLNKTYYIYSILFHLSILLLLIYLIELKKQKKFYDQKINVSLQYLRQTNEKKINSSLPLVNQMNEKTVLPIQKKNIIKKNQSENKINSNLSLTPSKKKVKKIENSNKNIEPIEKTKVKNELTNKTKKTINLKDRVKDKELKSNKKTKQKIYTNENQESEIFKEYNDNLKYLIQRKATENYPRISIRKKEQGIVDLAFSIDDNGNIKNIIIGSKTNASERLINSSIRTLKLISPYKKGDFLKKKNTFSIIIIYKLE